MDAFQEFLSHRKKLAWGILIGSCVCIGCFCFPVVNFERPKLITGVVFWLTLGLFVDFYYRDIPAMTVFILRTSHALALVLALTCAGLVCLYLLKFGEVSNTYSFTWPNMLIHLATVTVLALAGRRRTLRRER